MKLTFEILGLTINAEIDPHSNSTVVEKLEVFHEAVEEVKSVVTTKPGAIVEYYKECTLSIGQDDPLYTIKRFIMESILGIGKMHTRPSDDSFIHCFTYGTGHTVAHHSR
jgi:hypothetical protein